MYAMPNIQIDYLSIAEARIIPLTKAHFAIIDKEDFNFINQFEWCYSTGYAVRFFKSGTERKIMALHRFLMNPPEGMEVDHINGFRLDNRRQNLRIVTRSQNACNQPKIYGKKVTTSRYKGVCFATKAKKWQVSVHVGGKNKYVGMFDDEIEAALAYNEAAKKHFGEFARLNVITREG